VTEGGLLPPVGACSVCGPAEGADGVLAGVAAFVVLLGDDTEPLVESVEAELDPDGFETLAVVERGEVVVVFAKAGETEERLNARMRMTETVCAVFRCCLMREKIGMAPSGDPSRIPHNQNFHEGVIHY